MAPNTTMVPNDEGADADRRSKVGNTTPWNLTTTSDVGEKDDLPIVVKKNGDDDDSSTSDLMELSVDSGDEEIREVRRLTEGDNASIQIWRNIILFLLQVVATFVTVLTYIFLDHNDIQQFDSAYDQVAETVKDSLESNFRGFTSGPEGLAKIVSAHAVSSSEAWPNVVLPNFEVQVNRARQHSRADALVFAPLVYEEDMTKWNTFSAANQGWIEESFAAIDKERGSEDPIPTKIYNLDDAPITSYPLAPYWQLSPPPTNSDIVNLNAFSSGQDQLIFDAVVLSESFVIGNVTETSVLQYATQEETPTEYGNHHSTMMHPIFVDIKDQASRIVGIIISYLQWETYLQDLVPANVDGIFMVLRNSCGQNYTYELVEGKTVFVGEGDLHEIGELDERDFDDYETIIDLLRFDGGTAKSHGDNDCQYTVSLFPSTTYWNEYDSNMPYIFAIVVSFTSLLMATLFFTYDSFVETRTRKIVSEAAQSNAIVSSLFPTELRDRLFNDDDDHSQAVSEASSKRYRTGKHGLKTFLLGGKTNEDGMQEQQKPIADLFPDCTIMFADLVGFTAWASEREPSQVFTLLETLYQSFDEIVKGRRVFKVETVGDCYVAVAGLPEAKRDHAIAMARVARDCVMQTDELTRKLEVTLGPDTSELSIRVGLHSGPVTAGVLRGERARFQLFGDTMNVASRMEHTSEKGRIQISKATADLLTRGGKGKWIRPRNELVSVKGKGDLQTYWLEIKSGRFSIRDGSAHDDSSTSQLAKEDELFAISRESISSSNASHQLANKLDRLINWNVEVLGNLIKQIMAKRQENGTPTSSENFDAKVELTRGGTVLDEVKEIIALPDFDENAAPISLDYEAIVLDEAVVSQLREYVHNIAMLHKNNPFHNFEHASHVVMSAVKLLGRIVAPSDIEYDVDCERRLASTLHHHTYGITSDPLTQFSCCFGALIHDTDHPGVPNGQLIEENPALAELYRGKSVAEQNSIDLAWKLFMEDRFTQLRTAICGSQLELSRFRQLVVNSVMATDVMDKELKNLRNARWDRAFAFADMKHESAEAAAIAERDNVNRKATIVIEHLIQASDVAHTMQHWHIYRKWNAKLFTEMTLAYREGRAEKDPATFWYEGEIGFLDFYIIPLAKKLKECGVFGVSSDEYLTYAMENRNEWAEKGREVVAELVESLRPEGALNDGTLEIVEEHEDFMDDV